MSGPEEPDLESLDFSDEVVSQLLGYARDAEHREEIAAHIEVVRSFKSPAGWAARATRGTSEPFVTPPHISYLNDKLVDLVTGRLVHSVTGEPCSRLMVTMPPRHGKSELCSKYLPAWYLTRFPDRRIILAAYEATFAATWGQAARDLIEEHPWCGVEVRKDARASDDWKLVGHSGRMVTAGIGGPTTGKGATLLIIDDPVKNRDEADSPTFRDRNWSWYLSTARTRMQKPHPGSPIKPAVLVIQTRWHEDDLAGRILANEKGWEVINFPALAEETDVLGRQIGDPLWPEMYDKETLEETRELDSYTWGALYQQHPTPLDGGTFARENFRYWQYVDAGKAYLLEGTEPHPVKDCVRIVTADLAASTKTRADWTVFSCWDITRTSPPNLILVDRIRRRVETTEHMPMLEEALARWKPRYVGVEKATYGLSLLQAAVRAGLAVRPLIADKDKVSRAMPASDLVRQHRVFFPKHVSWLEEWEHEVLAFPNGTHDDQVDTFAYAGIEVGSHRFAKREKTPDVALPMGERVWAQLERNRKQARRHPTLGSW